MTKVLIHKECMAPCRNMNGPEPPDPDFHGNMRITWKCEDCGKKGTVLFPPHGGYQVPKGFAYDDELGVEM